MNTSERQVQFLPQHYTVLEINSLEDYTEEEILNCWYTKTELTKIAVRSYKDALRWGSGKAKKSHSAYRGLEVYTKEGAELIATNIEHHVDAVMDEQDAQWENEIDDYDRLAVVSEQQSQFSIAYALEKAKEDAEEAQKVYRRMEKKSVKKSKQVSSPMSCDDHTSVCSDLSHPETESDHSRDFSSSETIRSSLEFDQVGIAVITTNKASTEEQQPKQNKKRTEISRRVKALKMPKLPRRASRTVATGVSNAFKTICT
ncbi:MAG: hypothetical protein SGBAC_009357 [Bacillariaceae sp.]